MAQKCSIRNELEEGRLVGMPSIHQRAISICCVHGHRGDYASIKDGVCPIGRIERMEEMLEKFFIMVAK